MWRQAVITGSQGCCLLVRLSKGHESSLLFTRAASSLAAATQPPGPSLQVAAQTVASVSKQAPGRLLKGPQHRHTAPRHQDLGSTWDSPEPPEPKPGRWVPGRPAAQSLGPRREQAAPSCGQAGLCSPVKEDRHPLHGHDHGLAVGGGSAGLGGSAWTDFLLSWNRAVLCRWFVKLDGSGKRAWSSHRSLRTPPDGLIPGGGGAWPPGPRRDTGHRGQTDSRSQTGL